MKLRFSLLLLAVFTLCLSSSGALAFNNKYNLQIRLFASVPVCGFGIPLNNGDYLEFGYGYLAYHGDNIFMPIYYSKQLSESENERSAINIGAMPYHLSEPGLFSNKDGTYPILLYEQERLIGGNVSWLINCGIPNLLGLGIKYYL